MKWEFKTESCSFLEKKINALIALLNVFVFFLSKILVKLSEEEINLKGCKVIVKT